MKERGRSTWNSITKLYHKGGIMKKALILVFALLLALPAVSFAGSAD